MIVVVFGWWWCLDSGGVGGWVMVDVVLIRVMLVVGCWWCGV